MRTALFALMFTLFSTTFASGKDIKVAVTTSFHNSGLADILLPEIKADTGLNVQLIVVGTGQALRLGRAGDVDAILVHARAQEMAFLADGFGSHRREIMYNDFVFIGPRADPVGVADASDVPGALMRISNAQARFVSRGDGSGTHSREASLWAQAGQVPNGAWYVEAGAGMGATLNVASGMNAYTFSDRASWLNFGNKGDLALLFAGDPALFNQYAFLPVSPKRHPYVRHDLALMLEAWLTSAKAAGMINAYQIGGEQLFTFNATTP